MEPSRIAGPEDFEKAMDALAVERLESLGEYPDLPPCDLENPETCESCQ